MHTYLSVLTSVDGSMLKAMFSGKHTLAKGMIKDIN
jgi:hypothetical protein